MARILIAEDEPGISSFLRKGFTAAGFAATVVEDGLEALTWARDPDFDIVVLDLGLPRMDGHQVLTQLRARGERMPVIILTARNSARDTVAGLDGGADDYITKPFSFAELLARVNVRLREQGTSAVSVLQAGSVRLDLPGRRMYVEDIEVDVSTREFTVMELFVRHPEQVLSRDDILSHAWGYASDTASNVVEVCVASLRRKIGKDAIETVRGMGYRLGRPEAPGN